MWGVTTNSPYSLPPLYFNYEIHTHTRLTQLREIAYIYIYICIRSCIATSSVEVVSRVVSCIRNRISGSVVLVRDSNVWRQRSTKIGRQWRHARGRAHSRHRLRTAVAPSSFAFRRSRYVAAGRVARRQFALCAWTGRVEFRSFAW